MSWRYHIPQESDYDTYEEFREAMDAYERAIDDYCDMMEERRHM